MLNPRIDNLTGSRAANGLTSSVLSGATFAGLLATTVLLSGCGAKDNFAKVNGQVVTRAEYTKALERQTVAVPGGQPTNAERLVLDTIIGNRIILAEAAKANALPSDDEVNRYFGLQKKLFEQQMPGKSYEQTMSEQGTTPAEIKNDMKVQLAETNLYAKDLKLGEDQVRKAYEGAHGQIGLPARAQFRLIVLPPKAPAFQQAAQALAAPSADFDAIAKKINLTPALRSTGGLQAQATPIKSIGAAFQAKVEQTPEGKWFGPVDYSIGQNLPTMKAWVKIEKKLPGYTVSYDDAAPLVRRQLVQMQIMQPQNASIRSAIMQEKLKASFEPTDPSYTSVWDAVKKAAEDAGLGATPAASAPAGAVTPMDGAMGAPPAAAPPATK